MSPPVLEIVDLIQRWLSETQLCPVSDQSVLFPRKIGELELEFEIPTWNSKWDFEEFTVNFTVKFTVRFTIDFIINNITQKTKQENKQK